MPCSFSVTRFVDEWSRMELVRVIGRVDTVERDDDPTTGTVTGTYMQEVTALERDDIEPVFHRLAVSLYLHELDEWYKVDGVRMRDPHHDKLTQLHNEILARSVQGAPQEGLSVEKS
jgi:hypothetical protein